MSTYVFLGPTLPVEQARSILGEAVYLPPVSMGDVYALLANGPRWIALIDGLFERTPAVWHKEILYALAQGVRVLGSSSMGALRAAELHPFGMEGVGRIFEAYRDGLLEDDDEVALVHAPAEFGWQPLSEAMVNLREGLRRAERRGLITARTQRALLETAKRTFYPERSWPGLLRAGARLGLPVGELDGLRDFVLRERPDQKREDAVELLQHLARERGQVRETPEPNFCFESTSAWLEMQEYESQARGLSDAPAGACLGPGLYGD
jgi:hypothetical protein